MENFFSERINQKLDRKNRSLAKDCEERLTQLAEELETHANEILLQVTKAHVAKVEYIDVGTTYRLSHIINSIPAKMDTDGSP
jgi:hypothetical protein